MLVELLLLFIFVLLSSALYLLYNRYLLIVKTLASFKPVINTIGTVTGFTQNMEDALTANKEMLSAMITFLDHKLALANGELHERGLSNDEIQFILGQCDTYITVRGSMKTLLERKKKNDK